MTADRITVIEGLEAVRRRPAMWIGADHRSSRARLLELAVTDIAWEWRPQQVRILLWREDGVTIAYDGKPLPIAPDAHPVDGIPHPALYRLFMVLHTPGVNGLSILNALSERLAVCTMHGSHRYRSVFSKGMIASLLSARPCRRPPSPLATTWLTYRPDAAIVTGRALTADDLHGLAERVEGNTRAFAERCGGGAGGVRITIDDRMTEDADWD